MRKSYFYIAFLFLLAFLTLNARFLPEELAASSYYGEDSQIYLLSFPLPKTTPGTINTYMPEYKPVSPETARFYGGLFDMRDNETETEEYYIYQNQEGSIYIDKNIGYLRYETAERPQPAGVTVSPEEALQKALQFIEGRLLFLSYEESKVRFDGEFYEVIFVNLLSNIQNYAHPVKVMLDPYGQVLTMDYYFITYKRLGSTHIKSMAEAFWELPVDFPEGVKIPLTQCRLVYYYENSILQPAYLFEGSYPGDKSFSSFVKASVY